MKLVSRLRRVLSRQRKNRPTEADLRQQLIDLSDQILSDSKDGYVKFHLAGKESQVQCTFEWFANLTNGGEPQRVIVLRHALLAALNIALGSAKLPPLGEQDFMPVFIMHQGKPVIQYLFYGKTGCRCERYDEDLAEAMRQLRKP